MTSKLENHADPSGGARRPISTTSYVERPGAIADLTPGPRSTCRASVIDEGCVSVYRSRMALVLRPYGPTDVEAIARVFTDSVHELARPYYDDAQRAAWAPRQIDLDEWRVRLASMELFVADREGSLVGFIGYEPNGHVVLLYTASHAARTGVASTLYAHVEREWISTGVKRAFAEVSLAARAFFEGRGFVVEHEEQVERRGSTFTRYAMAKELPSS